MAVVIAIIATENSPRGHPVVFNTLPQEIQRAVTFFPLHFFFVSVIWE